MFFLAQMFLQLDLLPPLDHKEAIGTLGYPWVPHSFKTGGLVTFVHLSVRKQTPAFII